MKFMNIFKLRIWQLGIFKENSEVGKDEKNTDKAYNNFYLQLVAYNI